VTLLSSLSLLHHDRVRHALEYLIGGRSTFSSYVEICSYVVFAAVQPHTLRVQAKSLIHRYFGTPGGLVPKNAHCDCDPHLETGPEIPVAMATPKERFQLLVGMI
jgi:hypothetical protein